MKLVFLYEWALSFWSLVANERQRGGIYKRPSNATTPAQRASVQNKPCVDCGGTSPTMRADHKTPLVEEHYTTGTIDKTKMRSLEAVQPQCESCSNSQGGKMSAYSKKMKKIIKKRTEGQ